MKRAVIIAPHNGLDSGQTKASTALKEVFENAGIDTEIFYFHGLDRRKPLPIGLLVFAFRLACSWIHFLKYFFVKKRILSWGIGLTPFSWIRDGVPVYLLTRLRGQQRFPVIASIHGSNFTSWDKNSWKTRWFRHLLLHCSHIIVLGKQHKQHLVSIGIPETSITVLPNTTEMPVIEEPEIITKHNRSPVQLLHLSSLIDSKGYPAYAEAISQLPPSLSPVQAVLCGRFTGSPFSQRFSTESQAQNWIQQQILLIEQQTPHSFKWIEGAWGKDKEMLFHHSHIFVFPSNYPVEAQPLVLLEAMASGCAIITTDVGEIRTILSESEAVFIQDTSPDNLAMEITRLIQSPTDRIRLATQARKRFMREFASGCYQLQWENILEQY